MGKCRFQEAKADEKDVDEYGVNIYDQRRRQLNVRIYNVFNTSNASYSTEMELGALICM